MYTCELCNKPFASLRSLANHKNHHNPDYHHRSKQGALSSQKKATEAAKISNIKTAQDKYKNNKCLHCGKQIPYEKAKQRNKFCNHSCAASYNNSIKPKREKLNNKRIRKPYISKVERTCVICGSIFTNRNPVKSCSPECKGKLISKSIKKSFEEGRHKGNEYRSRISPSYMEKTFDIWLKTEFPECDYEKEKPFNVYENEKYVKTFYVDFFFPDINLGIELDGSHHLNQIEYDIQRDKYLKSNYGVNIIRIDHIEYRNKSKESLIRSLLSL